MVLACLQEMIRPGKKPQQLFFFSFLGRITKLMDGRTVLVVKYLDLGSLLMQRLVTTACKVSSFQLKLAQGHMFGKEARGWSRFPRVYCPSCESTIQCLVVGVPRLGQIRAPGEGFVSANLLPHMVLKIWVSVEKQQIKETYHHDFQSGIDIHQDQSISFHLLPSTLPTAFSAAFHKGFWSSCLWPFLPPPKGSVPLRRQFLLLRMLTCPLSHQSCLTFRAKFKMTSLLKVFLDLPARSNHHHF